MNSEPVTMGWECLVDALRLELQEYGGLLNLLEEQQKGILGRDSECLLSLNKAIEEQMEKTNRLRHERERLAEDTTEKYELDKDACLSELVSLFPEPAKPLLQALIERINAMLERIKHKTGQNRMLLARAYELIEEIMHTLQPGGITKTYNREGNLNLETTSRLSNVQFTA